MNLYLIRHAERFPERVDRGLTEVGVMQATATGKYLVDKDARCIFTSPLPRTVQTAEIISKTLNIPLSLDDRLKERLDFEEVPNLSYLEYLKLCRSSALDRNYLLPNGETSLHVGNKVASLVSQLYEQNKSDSIVLVSHGGAISDYLRNAFTIPILSQFSKRYVEFFEIRNCSITLLSIGSSTELKVLDSVDHLDK